jgi:hypothetical protein
MAATFTHVPARSIARCLAPEARSGAEPMSLQKPGIAGFLADFEGIF